MGPVELDEGVRKLIFILCLPLIDGVFATLLVTGSVQTFSDIVTVALTIFTGAGALAVLYSYSGSVKEARQMVLQAAPVLLAGAAVVSLVAPVFGQVLYVERMKIAAGLALVVISLELAGLELAEKFSVPGILLTGGLLSVGTPEGLYLSLQYLLPALYTASIAVIVLSGASFLRGMNLRISYIRKGGAVALLAIGISLFGVNIPSNVSLVAVAASFLASVHL